MKKQRIKHLDFTKKVISSLSTVEKVKGGITTASQTSCWCRQSECDCDLQDTFY